MARKTWSWIPLGIMAALLLSLAVAWSFRERSGRADYCGSLYAAATTAMDTARVDTTAVPGARSSAPLRCADVVGR